MINLKNWRALPQLALCIFLAGCIANTGVDDQVEFRILKDNSIINLYDAFGENDEALIKDFGFSCIVKYRGKTILFDAGTNADIFKNNVQALNIDLSQIDFAVASHAHFDHINGFDYLLEVNPDVKIYFPMDLFWGANVPFDLSGTDSTVTDSLDVRMKYFDGEIDDYHFNQTGRFWNANIEFVKESTIIDTGIALITTSSEYMGYFNKYPALEDCDNCEAQNARFNGLNEISLSLETGNGEVLFVGCSHSTVTKIVEATREYTNRRVELLYGGYHLLPYDRPTLEKLALRLKDDLEVRRLAPAHCTGHLAFRTLLNHYGDDYVFAGLGTEIGFE